MLVFRTLESSRGPLGSGVYCTDDAAIQDGPLVLPAALTSNTARDGGGLYSQNCALRLSDVRWQANTAHRDGGAALIVSLLPVDISGTVAQNTAGRHGGGVWTDALLRFLPPSELVGNRANTGGMSIVQFGNVAVCSDGWPVGGGALFWSGTAPPVYTGVTVEANRALYGNTSASPLYELTVEVDTVTAVNQTSGQLFTGSLTLAARDREGQIVLTEFATTVALSASVTLQRAPQALSGVRFAAGQADLSAQFGLVGPSGFHSVSFVSSVEGLQLPPPLQIRLRDCTAGEFFDGLSELCRDCPAGRYSNSSRQPACFGCEKGRFQDSTGTTVCILCGTGFHQPAPESQSCLRCESLARNPAFELTSFSGALGEFSNTNGSSTCSDCQPGTYADR